MITINKGEIRVTKDELFDPQAIFDCGQVFRFDIVDKGYIAYSGQKKARVVDNRDYYSIITKDTDYFYNYFDLGTDYQKIIDNLAAKPFMQESIAYAKGLRILRQDKFENIISFILSSNNNIKRIQGIINRLVQGIGEEYEDYKGFPTPSRMASMDVDFYRQIGAGYRADYVYNTAKVISGGFDIEGLTVMDTQSAKKELMKLKGVGSKVADCILLFGYSKKDVFPVDTWIKKVYQKLCNDTCDTAGMREYLLDLYGEYSGYAQQYLFYAFRDKKV